METRFCIKCDKEFAISHLDQRICKTCQDKEIAQTLQKDTRSLKTKSNDVKPKKKVVKKKKK